MCIWVSGWHALVQITAPGEPFSGGYSSPQNGRGISEPARWADAPELPASAPFVMSASLVRPAPSCPPPSAADGVDAVHGNLRCRSGTDGWLVLGTGPVRQRYGRLVRRCASGSLRVRSATAVMIWVP